MSLTVSIALLILAVVAGMLIGMWMRRSNGRTNVVPVKEHQDNLINIKALAFESLREAAALANAEGQIFSVNDMFVELFGFETQEQVLQTSLKDLWEDPSNEGSVLAGIREEGSFSGELGLKRVDGSSFIGMARGTKIGMPGSDELIYVVAVQDNIDLRAAEKQA
jgi:PAS domain S-box-containing protein